MKIHLITVFLFISFTSYAQTELYSKIESDFQSITNNFKRYLPLTASKSFEDIIEDFNKNLSTYLEGGYGLSFEELNKIRVMKKFSTAFENFYSALSFESNHMPCSMKDIRLVREYFPEISMSAIKYYAGDLIVYKIQVDEYCVYVARHTNQYSIKTVYYSAKSGNRMHSGNIGLAYKCVRKIIDNVKFNYSKTVVPVITKQDNLTTDPNISTYCSAE
jgi:hypothetical protein